MTDDLDTDEYATIRPPDLSARVIHDPADSPDPDSEFSYLSALDAPRWVILLAAVGAACAGVMMAAEAVRRIAGALGY